MKLYLTGVPEKPGVAVTIAVRRAIAHVWGEVPPATRASALVTLAATRPVRLAESDDETAIQEARAMLAKAGCLTEVDLPDEALQPTPEPSDRTPVTYTACQYALAAMGFAHGTPSAAIAHCAILARINGETAEKPGAMREAIAVLLDTFPTSLLSDVQAMMGGKADDED